MFHTTVCSMWILATMVLYRMIKPAQSVPLSNESVFDVSDFGAVGDNQTVNTKAFRMAIQAAEAVASVSQQSIVLVRGPGVYVVGCFNLTSYMTFKVERDAVVRGVNSRDPSQYTVVKPLPSYGQSRDVGYLRYQALIMTVPGSERITLTGEGTIDGGGAFWWNLLHNNELKRGRPHLIELYNTSDVEISRLTLVDSAFWTLHPVYSSRVHIHGLTILAPPDSPNTDGIDPDSSIDVLIENNTISCGDDHIAIKSGLDAAGRAFNMPSKNITVRYNTHLAGRGISIGSEVSGGVEDVRIEHCSHLGPSAHGLHIKTSSTRGGYVRNISYSNITLGNIVSDAFISLTSSYGDSSEWKDTYPNDFDFTDIRGIQYDRIRLTNNASSDQGAVGKWKCFREMPCKDFIFQDINLTAESKQHIAQESQWKCSNVHDVKIQNVLPIGLSSCMSSHNPSN